METYRSNPDTVEILSNDKAAAKPQSSEESDCPDTLYPMW